MSCSDNKPIHVGDLVTIYAKFTDAAGNLADPDVVTLKIEAPDGVITNITTQPPIVPISTGYYSYDLITTLPGIYSYQWTGSGSTANIWQVIEGSISVDPPLIDGVVYPSPLDMCTLGQVKSWLQINSGSAVGNSQDKLMYQMITAASVYWMGRTGRNNPDGSVPATNPFVEPALYKEWYDGGGNLRQFLRQSPIRSVDLLQINGMTVPPSTGFGNIGYSIDQNGRSLVFRSSGGFGSSPQRRYSMFGRGGAFIQGTQNVYVEYHAGFSSVPEDVNNAVVKQVALWYRRRNTIDLKQDSKPEGGGTLQYQSWELPPDIETIIQRYTRVAIV